MIFVAIGTTIYLVCLLVVGIELVGIRREYGPLPWTKEDWCVAAVLWIAAPLLLIYKAWIRTIDRMER